MHVERLIIPLVSAVILAGACNSNGEAHGVVPSPVEEKEPWVVSAKETPSSQYKEYKAYTVDRLTGFTPGEAPETDKYGGWKSMTLEATGFFRVEKVDGRWYLVSPEGHPMISAEVGNFVPGGSPRQQQALTSTFSSKPRWAAAEMAWLKGLGFTGVAGSTDLVKDVPGRTGYCVFINPMTAYSNDVMKSYKIPSRMPVVFGSGYDSVLSTHVSWITKYASDPFCIGITTDDELFWTNTMLEKYLTVFPVSDANRVAAQNWLDGRKGHAGASTSEITDEDKDAFRAYCMEEYLRRTSAAVHTAAPGIMYMGTRLYKWDWELSSQAAMAAVGKYTDLVSINHFSKWEPDQELMKKWTEWSGRPFMITSFDVKGEDSGLANTSGAGWIVPTQDDRGKFYENFVIGLLKSRCCVGWQWYTYQDNDPEDTTADSSNSDSNKGLVKWDFSRYDEVLSHMSAINFQLKPLCEFFNNK